MFALSVHGVLGWQHNNEVVNNNTYEKQKTFKQRNCSIKDETVGVSLVSGF